MPRFSLLIRLALGSFQLAESGWGHLTNVGKTADFFTSLHIHFSCRQCLPLRHDRIRRWLPPDAPACFPRFISIPLLFNFCVAYLTASHAAIKELLHFQSPDDFINDSAFPFLVTSLLILAFGAGKISLDYLLEKCCCKKSGASGSGSGS